jgi:hypothetical protein
MVPFGKPKLDSFRLIIPTSQVSKIDPRITQDFHRFYPELDMVDDEIESAKPLTNKIKGITSRYYIKSVMQKEGNTLECLVIQLNSKMLGSLYFEGITMSTISKVYDYIIAENLIYVDYRAFMQSMITDVDICIDFNLSPSVSLDVCKHLYEMTFYTRYVNLFKPTQKYMRAGIEYNSRPKATPGKPFVKMYHKTLELQDKSIEFKEAFLGSIDINDIFRLETTVKNSKDKEKHKIKHCKSLKSFLELSDSKLTAICKSAIPNYLEMKNKPKNPKGLSPTDEYLYNIIQFAIQKGCGTNEILNFAETISDKSSKSRTKTRIKNLLKLSDKKEVLNHNSEVHNFIKNLLE